MKSLSDLSRWIRGAFKNELTVELNNKTVRFDTSNYLSKKWFYPRYIDGEIHEPMLTNRLIEVLNSEDIFYDIGANTGWHSIIAAETNGCRVTAFEMNKKYIAKCIKPNQRINNLDYSPRFKIKNLAVSNIDNQVLHYADKNDRSKIINTEKQNNAVLSVSLDRYTERSDEIPDIAKIDVEGYEYDVLDGARDLLDSSDASLNTIFIELHPEKLHDYGYSYNDVINLLDKYNYDIDVLTARDKIILECNK